MSSLKTQGEGGGAEGHFPSLPFPSDLRNVHIDIYKNEFYVYFFF